MNEEYLLGDDIAINCGLHKKSPFSFRIESGGKWDDGILGLRGGLVTENWDGCQAKIKMS
jgi:hypothetical protein